MNNHHIGKAFEKLKAETWIRYGGLLWERTGAGFVHNGFLARDFHEMDMFVLQHTESLQNSINRKNECR